MQGHVCLGLLAASYQLMAKHRARLLAKTKIKSHSREPTRAKSDAGEPSQRRAQWGSGHALPQSITGSSACATKFRKKLSSIRSESDEQDCNQKQA